MFAYNGVNTISKMELFYSIIQSIIQAKVIRFPKMLIDEIYE